MTGLAVLVCRTFGAPGRRKDGPYHLVNQDQLTNLVGYPEYQAGALLQAWCGTRIRLGPSEALRARNPVGKWAPGSLNHPICHRCFTRRGSR